MSELIEEKYEDDTSSQYEKQFEQAKKNFQNSFRHYHQEDKKLKALKAELNKKIEKIKQKMNPLILKQEKVIQICETTLAKNKMQRDHAFDILKKFEIKSIEQGTNDVELNNDTPGGPLQYENQLYNTTKQFYNARTNPTPKKKIYQRNIIQPKPLIYNQNYIYEYGSVCNKICLKICVIINI